MTKSKTKFRDNVKEWSKEFYEKNKILTVIILFIIGIIFIGIIFKIVNKYFVFFIVIEVVLVIGLVLIVVLSKKMQEIWKNIPSASKVVSIILPLVLIGSTIWIGTLDIGAVPSILQIGKTTNPIVSTMDDPLIFLWDDDTINRVHTLVLEVEGETLVSSVPASAGMSDVGLSFISIGFYSMVDEDSPDQVFSEEFTFSELQLHCSNEENGYYTNFYWNSSGISFSPFVPELEKIYLFDVVVSDYDGDIIGGEQWFHYLEDVPLDPSDHKWIIIGSVFGVILIAFTIMIVFIKIRKEKEEG